jgi:hypothetical protein
MCFPVLFSILTIFTIELTGTDSEIFNLKMPSGNEGAWSLISKICIETVINLTKLVFVELATKLSCSLQSAMSLQSVMVSLSISTGEDISFTIQEQLPSQTLIGNIATEAKLAANLTADEFQSITYGYIGDNLHQNMFSINPFLSLFFL